MLGQCNLHTYQRFGATLVDEYLDNNLHGPRLVKQMLGEDLRKERQMRNSTALLLLNNDTHDSYIEDTAQAAIDQNCHLSCLLMSEGVATPPMVYGTSIYGTIDVSENWQKLLQEAIAIQNKRVEEIEQLFLRIGCSADVQSVICSPNDASEHIARRARVCDLAIVAPNLRHTPRLFKEAALSVLYKSPIGLFLNAKLEMNVSNAMIAWDGSHSASSAAHLALPILEKAEEVCVLCVDPNESLSYPGVEPGAYLSTWLSHHGCRVTLLQEASGGKEIAECIQTRAREMGSDLVIMGAYGHSRLLQAAFGGTTRAMLDQVELPVLLAH